DFHALRHSYITALGRGGVDLRIRQELAGHSTPVLTARYSHVRLHDLAGAVEKLPAILPTAPPAEALRATGTEGPQAIAYRPLTGASGGEGGRSREGGEPATPGLPADAHRKSANDRGLRETEGGRGRARKEAPPAFEPGVADLQSAALAAWLRGPTCYP